MIRLRPEGSGGQARFYIVLALIIVLALLCLVAFAALAPAHAGGMCGRRADFIKALNGKYQESPRAMGIAGQVNLVEVFASKSGTWTVLVTTPEGKTCIIAAGNSWEDFPPEIPGEKS